MTGFPAFFGDKTYPFALSNELIGELENKCGPIGALSSRVFQRQFSQADISDTIRLALIGGGQTPKRAAELIVAYVDNRPFAETYPLAAKILERLWVGNPPEAQSSEAANEPA